MVFSHKESCLMRWLLKLTWTYPSQAHKNCKLSFGNLIWLSCERNLMSTKIFLTQNFLCHKLTFDRNHWHFLEPHPKAYNPKRILMTHLKSLTWYRDNFTFLFAIKKFIKDNGCSSKSLHRGRSTIRSQWDHIPKNYHIGRSRSSVDWFQWELHILH